MLAMKVALAASFVSVVVGFCPAPKSLLRTPERGALPLPSRDNGMPAAAARTSIRMASSSPSDGGSDEQSTGPFTRKSLLEGVTKAAGVLGAGTFVQKGFVAGVPYNGSPDLSGKAAVITGGNTGLGKETAVRLAQLGADVTIACRNPHRAFAALEDIKAQAPGAKVGAMPLDLASLDSVGSFAKRYTSSSDRLDILVNNAGVMAIPERQATKDGFEMQFGTNHLGHFRLTSLLMPALLKSPDARVVNVASAAHLFASSVEWDDLNAQAPGAYAPWKAYGLSKLSNIYFTKALQRRVDSKGAGSITATSLHPGACRTELGRYLFDPSQPANPLVYPALAALTLVTRSPKEGAQTQIACAADPALGTGSSAGGTYYVGPKISELPSELARDPEAAERMWAASEKLVGKFSV
ncbi:unnamed protein product [Ectocarpus sp. 13 AM-2016]